MEKLHVGIIMDGNRRFSKKLLTQPWKGHEWGKEKLTEVLNWCKDLPVNQLTVFALSTQNLNRPKKELEYLLALFEKEIQGLLDRIDELQEEGLRIQFIGRRHLLPETLQSLMQQIEQATSKHTNFLLTFALSYGGREEIVDAIKKISRDVQEGVLQLEEIDASKASEYLELQEEPDLIIRTGGDVRTSNFLPWQSIYSEWFFVDSLWPELSQEEFVSCINSFSSRERRFGK